MKTIPFGTLRGPCRWLLLTAALLATLLPACSLLTAGQPAQGVAGIHLAQSAAEPPHSSVAAVIKRVLPSVVNVRVTDVGVNLFGQPQETKAQGSGVVIDRNGIILTNNHVIAGAVRVTVVFDDGHRPIAGRVIGADPDHDLAVIRVDANDLKPVTLGRSSYLELGDSVVAAGFPLGLGGPTVTEGIVSGLGRSVEVGGETGQVEHLVGLLQTDAAINPGNSGGALVDTSGQLVGINTAAAQAGSAENVGFAIAIDEALPVIDQILTRPASKRAWLGVQVATIDPAVAEQLGLPSDTRGALVVGVIPSGPAARAGLKQGDVIVALDRRAIRSAEDLTRTLTGLSPGETARVDILTRRGQRSVDVVLAASVQP